MEQEKVVALPKLGESIVSATVLKWFKKEGEEIRLDEPLLEVSTDKINSEIPSPFQGVLTRIVAQEGEEIAVGAPLAYIASSGGSSSQNMQREEKRERKEGMISGENRDFISPAVLRLLKERQIPLSEIDQIPGSGEGGRVTKRDVELYAASLASPGEGVEVLRMSPLRKAIADNMVRSFYQAPHASLATEVDVTSLLEYVQSKKGEFLERHKVKLSITPFVVKAICETIPQFPWVNASLRGDSLFIKKKIDLGVAVSVEEGVMVPVLRDCGSLGIVEIARQITSLAEKARSNTLTLGEVEKGSITLTNFGMSGISLGLPIIRYPEVAIIGMGAITRKAVVLSDGSIAPRSVLWVSLTFDHRAFDGMYGCGFLRELQSKLVSSS